jgi:hypothetical protein
MAEKDGVKTATLLLDFSEPIEGLEDERTQKSLNALFTFRMVDSVSGDSSSTGRPPAGIQATKIVRFSPGLYSLTVENVPESGTVVVDINRDGITPKSRLWHMGSADMPDVPEVPDSPSVVTGVDLTGYMDVPVQGVAPFPTVPGAAAGGYTASFEAPSYTGVITWSKSPDNLMYPGVFSDFGLFYTDAIYTATVTLTAKGGYTFTGLEANTFLYSDYGHADPGNTTTGWIHNEKGSGNTLTVTIVFPVTGSFFFGE